MKLKSQEEVKPIDVNSKLYKSLKKIIEEKQFAIIYRYHLFILRNDKVMEVWKNDELIDKIYDKYKSSQIEGIHEIFTSQYLNTVDTVINLFAEANIFYFRKIENAMGVIAEIGHLMESQDLTEEYSQQFALLLAMSMIFHVDDLDTVYAVSRYFRIALNLTEKYQYDLLEDSSF